MKTNSCHQKQKINNSQALSNSSCHFGTHCVRKCSIHINFVQLRHLIWLHSVFITKMFLNNRHPICETFSLRAMPALHLDLQTPCNKSFLHHPHLGTQVGDNQCTRKASDIPDREGLFSTLLAWLGYFIRLGQRCHKCQHSYLLWPQLEVTLPATQSKLYPTHIRSEDPLYRR